MTPPTEMDIKVGGLNVGLWSVQTQILPDGTQAIYFMYRTHTVGRFSGSVENAEYMVTAINAGLAAWAPIAAAVEAEAS